MSKPHPSLQVLLGTQSAGDSGENHLILADVTTPDPAAQAADAEEASAIGRHGWPRVRVRKQIPHDGDVNLARCMPQRPCWVASQTGSCLVVVTDTALVPDVSGPDSDDEAGAGPDDGAGGGQLGERGGSLAAGGSKSRGGADGDQDALAAHVKHCITQGDEGYGLAWSAHSPGVLLTASNDGQAFVWDLKCAPTSFYLRV